MAKRLRPSAPRTRKLSSSDRLSEQESKQHTFWQGDAPLPETPKDIDVTAGPGAVIRSLGPAPLEGIEEASKKYFEGLYQRSVGLASALASAADLVSEENAE